MFFFRRRCEPPESLDEKREDEIEEISMEDDADDLHASDETAGVVAEAIIPVVHPFIDRNKINARILESVAKFDSEECKQFRFASQGSARDGRLGAASRAKCTASPGSDDYLQERGSQVIVSEPFKLIYVPNMKAATQLFKYVMRTRFNATTLGTHLLQDYFAKHETGLQEYFIFTFVRDPIDTFYSAYSEIDKRMTFHGNKNLSFQKLNRTIEEEPARALECLELVGTGKYLRQQMTPTHMYSQVWKTQRCLENGGEILRFDFIGKLQNAREDFRHLEDLLGVPHKRLRVLHAPKSKFKTHAKTLQDLHLKELEIAVKDYLKADYACF